MRGRTGRGGGGALHLLPFARRHHELVVLVQVEAVLRVGLGGGPIADNVALDGLLLEAGLHEERPHVRDVQVGGCRRLVLGTAAASTSSSAVGALLLCGVVDGRDPPVLDGPLHLCSLQTHRSKEQGGGVDSAADARCREDPTAPV